MVKKERPVAENTSLFQKNMKKFEFVLLVLVSKRYGEVADITSFYRWPPIFKSKRRPKISTYSFAVFEYKRIRLFLSVYSMFSVYCILELCFLMKNHASCVECTTFS